MVGVIYVGQDISHTKEIEEKKSLIMATVSRELKSRCAESSAFAVLLRTLRASKARGNYHGASSRRYSVARLGKRYYGCSGLGAGQGFLQEAEQIHEDGRPRARLIKKIRFRMKP